MKKKIVLSLLTGILVLSTAACGEDKSNTERPERGIYTSEDDDKDDEKEEMPDADVTPEPEKTEPAETPEPTETPENPAPEKNEYNTYDDAEFDNTASEYIMIGYNSEHFSVYDSQDNLLYEKIPGSPAAIYDDNVSDDKYTGMAGGSLLLPGGNYKVIFQGGTISFGNWYDYAGIKTEDDIPVKVENNASSSLKVSSDESVKANLVVQDVFGNDKYICVGTDIMIDSTGCDISLKHYILNINTYDKQKFDIDIEGDAGYGERLGITSKDTVDLDLSQYVSHVLVEYTITYDLDGGTADGNPTSFNRETGTFTLNNPTKNGYQFIGWTGSNGDIPQTYVVIGLGEKGDREYKANWAAVN
ncbi:MAG: InlB B-repeat-containing protein [Lachnospiraceae bacterium]|nr:InlB B-repeat-containing protein [Lachnospiraceae bacterium]